MKKIITYLKNLENAPKKLLWYLLISLSALFYPFLLNLEITSKTELLAYLLACVFIISFEFITYGAAKYLQTLLEKSNSNVSKKSSFLIIVSTILLGLAILTSIAFLRSISNVNAFLIIVSLLPLNISLHTKNNSSKKTTLIKILRLIILIIYPILFYKIVISKALIVAGLAWTSLFVPKIIIENIKLYELENSKKQRLFKLIIFLLANTSLLLTFLASVGTLQREYTYISLPILYIFIILKVHDIQTKEKQEVLKKQIDNYIMFQLIITLMLLFYIG